MELKRSLRDVYCGLSPATKAERLRQPVKKKLEYLPCMVYATGHRVPRVVLKDNV